MDTNELMNMLERADSRARQWLSEPHLPNPTFRRYLLALMRERQVQMPQLICMANISKSYGYQLLRGERRAGRDLVLRIGMALRLSVPEMQRLLTLSGNSVLYPKVRRDALILFALYRKLSLMETEEVLSSIQERGLYNGE